MSQNNSKTLRLLMPQWQGGNNGVPYPLGARLLAWLAPDSNAPLVEVPVTPYEGQATVLEDGIIERNALLKQLRAAQKIIEAYAPERIVVFGGDCLVSQAPFAYLNELYGGKLGVLWIDAHPDITAPGVIRRGMPMVNEHAMVLGNLLGEGDPVFAAEVKIPLRPERVMLAGLDVTTEQECEVIDRLGLHRVNSAELADYVKSGKTADGPIPRWLRENKIEYLAVHLDLDVLDPKLFRSLYFNNPEAAGTSSATAGKLSFPQVINLIKGSSG